jgi:hypothetical protein
MGVGYVVEYPCHGGLIATELWWRYSLDLSELPEKIYTISFYALPVCRVAHKLDLAALMHPWHHFRDAPMAFRGVPCRH